MFWPHRAIFSQRILLEPPALCSLMSVALVEVSRYFSQFSILRRSVFVLRLISVMCNICLFVEICLYFLGYATLVYQNVVFLYLRAPLFVPLPWSCVPCTDLMLLYIDLVCLFAIEYLKHFSELNVSLVSSEIKKCYIVDGRESTRMQQDAEI
jgi:hypothetical protein